MDGVGPDALDERVEERSLFYTWAMRGSPFFFPTADLEAFTTGVLPQGEEGTSAFHSRGCAGSRETGHEPGRGHRPHPLGPQ
ncbi:DNA glycosylase AlkZ-like family protein [Sciscionella marina]|uniref:DNA glycosylase AlkZ-like family protein n=1 Tax=Sciscionella marina TaxID=508770 RepID=UPI00196A1B1B